MRAITILSLICVAGTISGCSAGDMFYSRGPGGSIEFVAANTDSVLLDFSSRQAGELAIANDTATQQCQIFSRRTAVLESLNVRNQGVIRATYLCKNPIQTAAVMPPMQRRQ